MWVVRGRERSEGRLEGLLLPISAKLLLDRVRDISTSAPGPGDFVKPLDELLGKQQVRAHVHAHTIAHDRAPFRRPRRRTRYGEAGPKAAQDCGGLPVDPDRRTFERDEAAFERVVGFLEDHLPGALGPPIYTKTCLYTLTPERDFVVDRLPDQPGVVVALGAGHGFKFASVLGRILAELSMDGMTLSAPELEGFRIDRPILLEADPVTSWMV